jgi:cysteine desulfuration protein SufE
VASIEQIIDDFALLTDWEDRFEYLIDLGRGLEPLREEERVEGFRVHGCTSQVWLVPAVAGGRPAARLSLRGDSDALIVKGLVAVVIAALSGRLAGEILAYDIDGLFTRLGLHTHLTPNRRSGFAAMVGRVRALAQSLMVETGGDAGPQEAPT